MLFLDPCAKDFFLEPKKWTGPKIILNLWKDEALEFCLCCILQSVFASFMMILGTQEHIGAITFVKSYLNYKV